jgi:hypothetical protein
MGIDTRRIFVILIVALTAIVLVNRLLLCFSYYTDLGGVEETFVYYAQRFSAGQPIYTNPEEAPFFINQYSPLSTVLMGSVYTLLGLKLTVQVHSLFVIGRLVQLALNIAQCFLVFYLLRKAFTIEKTVAFIGACLMFLFFFSHNYAIRPDSLKSFFVMAYITVLIFYLQKPNVKLLVLSALFIALAVLSKQDGVIVFCVTIFWLIAIRRYEIAKWVGLFGTMAILVAIAACYRQSGNLFYVNVIKGLGQGANLAYFKSLVFYIMPEIFGFAAIVLVLVRFREYLKQSSLNGVHILLLACLIFLSELLSTLKWGSSPVYFSEFITISIIGAVVVAHNLNAFKIQSGNIQYVPYAVLLLLVFEYSNGVSKKWYSKATNISYRQAYFEGIEISNRIRTDIKGFSIFSTQKLFINQNFDLCIFPTYEAEFVELMEGYTLLTDRKNLPQIIFNYKKAEEMVENGKVRYVAAYSKLPAFLGLQNINYEEIWVGSGFKVYKLR